MIHETFTLPAEDGEEIRGDLRMPHGSPPRSAIVIAHGFKGFKDWGFFPLLCEALSTDGHAAISFNFSLNGIGEDPLSLTRLDAFSRNTLSREVRETVRVIDEVRKGGVLPSPPERVGLLGHSRGGGVAILAARAHAEAGSALDALVTWSAVAEFGRWTDEQRETWRRDGRIFAYNSRTGQQLPLGLGLLDDFEANREALDVERAAASLKLPWLIVHGEADATVEMDDARRLSRANPGAALEIVPGAGHTFEARHPFDGSNDSLDHVLEVTRGHFRRHLLEKLGTPSRKH